MNKRICISAMLLGLGLAVPAIAELAAPNATIPIARLIENLEAQLAKSPNDARLHAQLARVHGLVCAQGYKEVQAYSTGEPPNYALFDAAPSEKWVIEGAVASEFIGHLRSALQQYQKAVTLAPEEPDIWLGFAYTCEAAVKSAALLELPVPGVVEEVVPMDARVRLWEDKAAAAYVRVFQREPRQRPNYFFLAIEREAALAVERILEPRSKKSKQDKHWLKAAKQYNREWEKKPRPLMVSPIVFSLHDPKPLQALLAPQVTVNFDLDGFARNATWPWLQPDTALLVWDGDGDGKVTSGRELIGSVTWWIFWKHGYQVLAALDDDRDGWLAGAELTGLAVWRDVNQNAISDPGEIVPVHAAGVKRLGVHMTGTTEGMPMHATGLETTDGRSLPTYDWFASEIVD